MQVKLKQGICSSCGKDKLIINKSKKLCFICNNKASMARQALRKAKRIADGKAVDLTKMARFYKTFWRNSKQHVCFETGEPLYVYRAWHVHHLLEKKDYPHLAYNEDICVLLTLNQHALWHSLTDEDRAIKMPKTYAKYLQLKQKYNAN